MIVVHFTRINEILLGIDHSGNVLLQSLSDRLLIDAKFALSFFLRLPKHRLSLHCVIGLAPLVHCRPLYLVELSPSMCVQLAILDEVVLILYWQLTRCRMRVPILAEIIVATINRNNLIHKLYVSSD